MHLSHLFDVFSRRKKPAEKPRTPLTHEFRQRVLMRCRDHFSGKASGQLGDHLPEFWDEMHRRLTLHLGQHRLSDDRRVTNTAEDTLAFLHDCSDDHFLDFVEHIFQIPCYWRISPDENALVEEINDLLLLDDLPYALTRFVRESRMEEFLGQPREARALVASPRVVLREHQVTHAEAISPALQFLADKGFSSANQEFLGALEDYRKGRYAECLTKCGSAFESTMKLVCARRRWPYSDKDTANQLLKTIRSNSSLEGFLEQPLLAVAMLRNQLGSAHGAGATPRIVPPHKARYALNATAAAILLVVEECG